MLFRPAAYRQLVERSALSSSIRIKPLRYGWTAASQSHPQVRYTRNMSSNIVLPSLSTWAEQRLTALFQITNETDFDAAYAAFFTKNPKITVNGKTLSSDAYKKQIWSGKGLEQGAQVAYSGAVEVPDNTAKPIEVCDEPHTLFVSDADRPLVWQCWSVPASHH